MPAHYLAVYSQSVTEICDHVAGIVDGELYLVCLRNSRIGQESQFPHGVTLEGDTRGVVAEFAKVAEAAVQDAVDVGRSDYHVR